LNGSRSMSKMFRMQGGPPAGMWVIASS
jgi:hypothetical protein